MPQENNCSSESQHRIKEPLRPGDFFVCHPFMTACTKENKIFDIVKTIQKYLVAMFHGEILSPISTIDRISYRDSNGEIIVQSKSKQLWTSELAYVLGTYEGSTEVDSKVHTLSELIRGALPMHNDKLFKN